MPAPSKRPLSAGSSSANKKAKVASKPTVKEESKRKVPVTASSSKRDQLDLEEAQIDEEGWKGDEVSDFDDDEEDDEDVEVDGEGDEPMEGAEGEDGVAAEPKVKDPEGEHTADPSH